MPGWKLTMLPDDVVQAYTLTEGRDCPAVSLYVTLDEATLDVKGSETRLERVPVAGQPAPRQARRRGHGGCRSPAPRRPTTPSRPSWRSPFGWRGALKARREVVRGKPESFNRPDYNFRLEARRRTDGPGADAATSAS